MLVSNQIFSLMYDSVINDGSGVYTVAFFRLFQLFHQSHLLIQLVVQGFEINICTVSNVVSKYQK